MTADHVLLAFAVFVGIVIGLAGASMWFLRDRLFSHHRDEDDED